MIGKTLKHYEVESLLGRGGMGEVYRARDTRLNRPVALKVLRPELTHDAERRRRFLLEARSASAVTHPAIAQVYDIDEVEGTIFLAMEFVEGQTVRQLIEQRELDLQGAVEIASQVADGLARAHGASIVHRDIKSDNIMVTRDGHAKILDFGLAKLLDPTIDTDATDPAQMETVAQTQLGTVMGTVAYMSPEQARGRPVDRSSDVFSIGVVIYEMVTGELPFKGDSPLDTMHAIAYEEVRPVTVVRRHLPVDLHRIVSRCLRKRAQDRYADAAELAGDLKALKRDLESGAHRTRVGSSAESRIEEARAWVMSLQPSTLIVGGLLLITLVLVIVLTGDADMSGLVVLAIIGFLGYRWIKRRKARLIRALTRRISRLSEVRAITVRDMKITVILDEAPARVYVEINKQIERFNDKIHFGDPIETSLRDDVSPEELKQILRQPGVVYLKDDDAEQERGRKGKRKRRKRKAEGEEESD